MFKVLNAYAGWSNVNYVLNNVRNPVRTLKIAGPLGLAICAALYLLANIAYFGAATKVRRPFPFMHGVHVVSVQMTGPDRVLWSDCSCFVFQQCVWKDRRACIECLCCSQVGSAFLFIFNSVHRCVVKPVDGWIWWRSALGVSVVVFHV